MSEQFSVIGKRVSRKDALEKVTGEAKYVADLQLPGMLHARFLRSPHAHARIADIDTSLAEALPGVKAILTHKNVPKVHPRAKLRYVLDETVHSAGEEVAAVAAVSREIADEAIKLIKVNYEVLPAVFDAEEAMKPGAPLAYLSYGTNLYHGTPLLPAPRVRPDGWLPLEIGDVAKGFAEADHIVEGAYETPMQYHCSPMPRSVLCQWTGGKLTCWACTQKPTAVWQDLAKCLGVPQSAVRVIVTYAVGGYGGKEPEETAVMAAILAKRTGRPVKAVFTREEDVIATRHRPNYKVYEKIGVKNDGTITAMQHKMIGNFGKDSTLGYLIHGCAAVYTCNTLYPCPNTKFEGCLVLTNIDAHGSMNGFGDAEANYCVDRALDEAAEKLGMDPVEFRLKNCMRYGTRGLTADAALGLRGTRPAPDSELHWGIVGKDADSVSECIRKVAEEARWR
ncbi:MAG: molybdopterin-dependent oxidoreductase, partial [Betaproteobacteria bacterium]|nr:molybdopterin-dependent oxidoreductase [Betaproteobacteria bacterium]